MDFAFTAEEDFGLASSFSTAPFLSIAPQTNFVQKENVSVENQYTAELSDSVITDGFCFKLAPGEDVSHIVFC